MERKIRTSKTRNEDTRRKLNAKGNDGQSCFDDQSNGNSSNNACCLFRRVYYTQAGLRAPWRAFGEKAINELGTAHASVRVDEAQDAGNESNL